MTEDELGVSIICSVPTEVLLYIFSFLPPTTLFSCRSVCTRWQLIIDSLSLSETFWQKHCENDFADIFKVVQYKSQSGLSSCNIYRSLTLWAKLLQAREIRDEFASASTAQDEIRDFQILRHGTIGVHTRGAIIYYDLNTFQISKRSKIIGNYLKYLENDDLILLQNYNLSLFIVRKYIANPIFETNPTLLNVKSFLLVGRDVYYVTLNDEIYLTRMNNSVLSCSLLLNMAHGVMSLGFKNGYLNILTFDRTIFTLRGEELKCVRSLEQSTNILYDLRKYNFVEQLDWRIYYQWMYVINHSVPQGPLRDIIIVRSHGHVVFVGSNWGVLRIYYSPHWNEEFDLFKAEPIKQYNFMERYDCPVLSMCPIIQIDVVEGEDSHKVLVAMPKKIAILYFVHNFKRTASDAMLSLNEVQDVKMLKISE